MNTIRFRRRWKISCGKVPTGMVSWTPIILALSLTPCHAADSSAPVSSEAIQSLRKELSAMRRQQQTIAARIEQIEAVLDQSSPEAKPSGDEPHVIVKENTQASAKPRLSEAEPLEKLQFSGDLRLRYEGAMTSRFQILSTTSALVWMSSTHPPVSAISLLMAASFLCHSSEPTSSGMAMSARKAPA